MLRPPAWFQERRPSLLLRLALLPVDVASWLYGWSALLHRVLYERGMLQRGRLACRVVSVGNLTVGGSGKTPTSAWLATSLRRRGWRVAIASRGYGRLGRERVEVVSDGRRVRSSGRVVGDEPLLLAGQAPGVPVLVGRHRDLVGLRAVAAFGTQVLVLDDGFQHHRLHRDVDLVLVDGASGFGNGRVLPRGPLREAPAVLSRADAVLEIDGPLSAADEALLAVRGAGAPRFRMKRQPVSVRGLGGGARQTVRVLEGRSVGLLCGIANPAAFRATLASLQVQVVAERVFPDHHRYREDDLRGLAQEAQLWITTEKDAVKIAPRWVRGIDLRVLAIRLEAQDPEALLDWLEPRLRARPSGRDAALPSRPGAA